jgi:hypothetical protein
VARYVRNELLLDHIIDHMLQCCSCAHELLDQAAGRTLGGRWAYMWRRVSRIS